MPTIEYVTKTKKIKRKFTPEWNNSGDVNIDEALPRYLSSLISQKKSMIQYIEMLHNEIDRLQEQIGNQQEDHES